MLAEHQVGDSSSSGGTEVAGRFLPAFLIDLPYQTISDTLQFGNHEPEETSNITQQR